jgi:hypothetical protein
LNNVAQQCFQRRRSLLTPKRAIGWHVRKP